MNNLLAISQFFKYTDIYLCVILFIVIIIGKKRGFLIQVIGVFSFVASFLIALIFAKPLFDYLINNTTLLSGLESYLNNWVVNTFTDIASVNMSDIEGVVSTLPFPTAVRTSILNTCQATGESTVALGLIIAQTIFRYIGVAFCFIGLYIVSKLCFKLLKLFVHALREIKPIRWGDEALGIIFMIMKLLAVLYIVCFLINILPIDGFNYLKEIVANSFILRFLTNHNLFAYLIKYIQK